jgi:uncharacterized membrane protein
MPGVSMRPGQYTRALPLRMMKRYKIPLLLICLHIPLGLLLYSSGALALLHPLIVLAVGLLWAGRKNVPFEKVTYATAYLVGVEVLWRMARSPVFWEFGKYGAAAIMIVALVRRGHLKIPPLPLIYLGLLIPSCFLTFINNDFETARMMISSNMSGPIALFISCWYFSAIKMNWLQIRKTLIFISIPLISVAVATLFFTVTIENLTFGSESNTLTSGGFGPNQVSAMLGLGVFVCLTCLLLFNNDLKTMLYLGLGAVFFAAQSVMTFSRGGIYNAVGAALVVIVLQMRDLNKNIKKFLPLFAIGLLFLVIVFPYLDGFTGGKLQQRFRETSTTNRTEIVESDLELFLRNPFLGVGVGEAKSAREEFYGRQSSSHTEFTRLISEHGILGVFSLIALAFGTFYNFRRQRSGMGKALVAGTVVWGCLFMLNAGMRLAAPSFMWGMSFLTILPLAAARIRRPLRFPNRNLVKR